ncbi:nicotinamidase-related amidase [Ulvibacter sp. MAR_2010_11]|uniref:cysteine hydrolase family protein n=1 Tax=Ulvibacter sp. MAR_2010_11 TaxID=1250229 RepID=UPI000C2BBC0A|nr:cysteine hydrolase family protein [Ulvibacter sp. MAR_2010_11]PKA82624.1 nicotinamidase-related amidase [Ulvibacter sp. MAR_2010_11]
MKKAIILIGYQNDYFAKDGILRSVVEESSKITDIIRNTVNLIANTNHIPIISTPIIFSENYEELSDPVGILETIKSVKGFKKGTKGAETIDEIKAFGDRITNIPGKLGLNAFVNTPLDSFLKEHHIEHLLIAGTVASICIDSTGRSAFEKGYKVTMLSDCISGRTNFEKDFYCDEIFPLYATVETSIEHNF